MEVARSVPNACDRVTAENEHSDLKCDPSIVIEFA